MKKGIDISRHQGRVDFDLIKSDGVDFAIPRIGYSTREDEMFSDYVKGFDKVGIDIPGAYLFSYALSVDHAVKEADFAVATLNALNMRGETIIFYDLEQDSIRYAKGKGLVIDKDDFMVFTKAFCDRVIELGYAAGIYFNMDYYRNMYDPELLDDYVKWLADWSGEADVECVFHQYTSKGSVKGISGNVDMNFMYELKEEDLIEDIVLEVFEGDWGNGEERKERLTSEGHDYDKIQEMINKLDSIAELVIKGDWGNGEYRRNRLQEQGHNHKLVQQIVNIKLKQEV